MPMVQNDSSDLEKLTAALSFITEVRNFDDVLHVFGVENLPTAQKYGILFGCVVFTVTISTVMFLLVAGGSFKRIAEQEKHGGAIIPDAIEERAGRPLLLERLLESRERLLKKYPIEKTTEDMTPLTKSLLNIAPDVAKAQEVTATLTGDETESETKKKEALKKFIPDGYEENYIYAYRRCQDKPGGPTLSGLPEARFEAYARAYAGCGPYMSTEYRRSYGRMYEAVACSSHANEEKYRKHWLSRPGDIVGRTVRLEPLEADRHLIDMFAMTSGDVYGENHRFDPIQVWAFFPEGPFDTPEELRKSFVFQRKANEACFAIVESITDKMIGAILLTNDDPLNLTISIELPILKPSSEGTVESIEGSFLLIDRLFAMGYRRIQLSIDSMDVVGKRFSGRLGFTQEGLVPKDRVVKESNRDSIIYGMLNSDWTNGARSFMYKKLHGEKAMAQDLSMNKRENELETQENFLSNARLEQILKK